MMKKNIVRDKVTRTSNASYVALLSQIKGTLLLKIILIYDDPPTERPLAGTPRVAEVQVYFPARKEREYF